MKIAVASVLVASLAVANAFVPGNNAFVRTPTNLSMATPAEFVKAEVEGNDVSSHLVLLRSSFIYFIMVLNVRNSSSLAFAII